MKVNKTLFDEVKIITPTIFSDDRGFFMETFNFVQLKNCGIENNFIQDNHSLSVEKGTIRGLHFQTHPKAQTKIVRVICGSIFDVVVDIRGGSSTFGKWYGIELSAENKKQLLIPKGFAHGFCTLENNTEVVYKVDEYYMPEFDRGIIWNDEGINIDWPTYNPILSEKDKNQPKLKFAEIQAFA
ncbi:dTDP-4-dehydrorhamnose 3,5-epimerase [Bacillus sp. MM2020_1]|nr:dTDP-4-dehydrorhamnose 3,5-epimerase [Bacillus sp. MM2020_1]